jgi:hypothetical protein
MMPIIARHQIALGGPQAGGLPQGKMIVIASEEHFAPFISMNKNERFLPLKFFFRRCLYPFCNRFESV